MARIATSRLRCALALSACAWALPALLPGHGAQAQQVQFPPESIATLLHKVHEAAQTLDYSGVFTYQRGTVMQSSRIVHIVDGTGERERLEILDGEPREFLRHNNTIQCLVPSQKLILREPQRGDRFPALLLGTGEAIAQYYEVSSSQSQPMRVAGRPCNVVELLPRDAHRYGYRFCLDTSTYLLLKAQTLNADHEVVDQVAFTHVKVGKQAARDQLPSSWDTRGWKVIDTVQESVDLSSQGWRIPLPPGFAMVSQFGRLLKPGRQVSQMVASDGLAAISIFVERVANQSVEGAPRRATATRGALNIERLRIGEYWLTAMGEVPGEALRTIAERTEYVPLAGQ